MTKANWKKWEKKHQKHSSSAKFYGLGMVGSFVYWMQAASGFGAVVTGILKALTWPAYIAYKFLESFYGVVS